MALTLRTARCMTAVVALAAVAAFGAARANHFILPCGDVCVDPHWALTGSLNTARSLHSATSLQDGRVLVAGGRAGGFGVLDSAELYDPATGTWSVTGHMSAPRIAHTATLLSDGRVLVAGGDTSSAPPNFGVTNSAELYDPTTGLWRPTGAMIAIRTDHSATLLRDGRVLVAGGGSDTLGSAELYDPTTNTWSATGSLNAGRYLHTATLLQDGRVLVVGGSNAGDLTSALSSAELYDPLSGKWSMAGNLGGGGVYHTATLLPNGKVLVAGGNGGGIGGDVVFATSEQFDPVSQTWTRTGDLSTRRYSHTATLLRSGDVLISGGILQIGSYPILQYETLDLTERFDPNTATWIGSANLNAERSGHTATLLSDGTVLVAGGIDIGPDLTQIPLASAELYGVTAGAQPLQSPPQTTTVAVEYYSLRWDDYFLTAFPDEITALDVGASHVDASGSAWLRTGQRFNVYPTDASASNSTVWRFLSRSFASTGSHFYTADVTERDALLAGAGWQLEGAAFSAPMPASDGTCPDGSIPVYRMYNDSILGATPGTANPDMPHHRLTTNINLRAVMLARGWIPEGPGIGVAFCSPE